MEAVQIPRRSLISIQPLPSIYTAFSNHYTRISSSTNSGGSTPARIEDGLEVVPLERESVLSAPILSPGQEEKEVFLGSQKEWSEKPLPSPPRSPWKRMSVKYRVISLLGLQAAILLTIGLALLSVKQRNSSSDVPSEPRKAGDNITAVDIVDPIRRGTFALPIESAQQQSSTCLTHTNESRAWQCMFSTNMQLNILPSPGDTPNKTLVTLGQAAGVNKSIHCGHQAPEILPTELVTVVDSEKTTSFRFQTTYNRTVILRGDQLSFETVPKEQGQFQHTSFKPGDSLWRCTFEETQLEGYINVDRNPTAPSSETVSPSSSSQTAQIPRMPYALKLVEQITSSDNPAYCERVEVASTGDLLTRSEKIVLKLAESTSSSSNDHSCRCQWAVSSAA